ncbi:hypothetical protein VTK73DRAFT_3879 [Phialemonium thermophilum]|uniref:Uncharacterized protein n=1 Tax=Phialemonium thermophilum TaxID=223376 RepID=A0ABR3WX87_9PEZI
MAPNLSQGMPSPAEVQRRTTEWDIEHGAIQAAYDAAELRYREQLAEEKKKIETEFEEKKRVILASASVHQPLLRLLDQRRLASLEALQNDYDTKQIERRKLHEQSLLRHVEEYYILIGFSGPSISRNSSTEKALPSPQSDVNPAPALTRSVSRSAVPEPCDKTSLRQMGIDGQPSKPSPEPQIEGQSTDSAGQIASLLRGPSVSVDITKPQTSSGRTPQTGKDSDQEMEPTVSSVQTSAIGSSGQVTQDAEQSRKRKAFSPPTSPPEDPKRARADTSTPREHDDTGLRRTQKRLPTKRSISFDEVYQDGDAEYKHMIVEYPPGEGNWYILKCDEHGVHFNLHPLTGAAKHLNGVQHGCQSKEHSLAIAQLGHMVFDCDAEMAAKNNAMVQKAFEQGYRPFNRKYLRKSERDSFGFPPVEIPAAKKAPKISPKAANAPRRPVQKPSYPKLPAVPRPFTGIAYPVPGELYLAYWSQDKTKYAAILLPWGDLAVAGMRGRLSNTALVASAPRCYLIDRLSQEIKGWAKGYEDGGPLVTQREFPVMYFDRFRSVGWLKAKHLSLFDMEDPNAHLVPEFERAREHYARAHDCDSYDEYKARRRELGLPEKRFSDVKQPSPTMYPAPSTPPTDPPLDKEQVGQENGGAVPLGTNSTKLTETPDPARTMKRTLAPVSRTDGDSSPQRGSALAAAGDVRSNESPEIGNSGLSRGITDDQDAADAERRRTPASGESAEETGGSGATESHTVEEDTGNGGDQHDDQVSNPLRAAESSTNGATDTSPDQPGTLGTESDSGPDNVVASERSDVPRMENMDTTEVQNQSQDGKDTGKVGDPTSPVLERPSLEPTAATAGSEGDEASEERPRSPPGIAAAAEKSIPKTPSTRAKTPETASRDPEPTEVCSSPKDTTEQQMTGVPPRSKTPPVHADQSPGQGNSVGDRQSLGSRTPANRDPPIVSSRASSSSPLSSLDMSSPSTPSTLSRLGREHTMSPTRRDSTIRPDERPAGQAEANPPAASDQTTPTLGATAEPHEVLQNKWPVLTNDRFVLRPERSLTSAGVPTSTSPRSSGRTSFRKEPDGAGRPDLFELAGYEDDKGTLWLREKDRPYLSLKVNLSKKIAEAAAGHHLVPVQIDPADVSSTVIDSMAQTGNRACRVTVVAKDSDGRGTKQRLVFEATQVMGREESAKVHARRFCRWVKSINPRVEYENRCDPINPNQRATSTSSLGSVADGFDKIRP